MPVLGNVHPIKISLLARVVILLIDTATQEVPMTNIWKKLSVQFLRYAIELLHDKSRTLSFADSMSNINCGIGVLHVKRQILTYFWWRHFSARSSFYCFGWYGIQRGVYTKILNIFYGSVFMIWLYLQKTMYRPCDLDLWPIKVNLFQWIDNNSISVLYEFQIDISTNSWEINTKIRVYAFYMLNVAHVKNDVKWRPIVTKFGTLIENMNRKELYDCHNFKRISNFSMGVLHVKVKYWRIFCDVISLLPRIFIVSLNRVS